MMRIHSAALAAVLLATMAAGCGPSDEPATKKPAAAAATPSHEVDCSDTSLSQAEWIESCGEETEGEPEAPSTDLEFGKAYAWPDGLEVTVLEAKTFTDWSEYEEPDSKSNEFRIRLKLDNKSGQSVNLDDISVLVDGATNGGEASSSSWEKGSAPLEGRLAPGVSAVKTDDNSLEKRYGKAIVVTVQRSSDDGLMAFPEFNGTIE
ncbi:hypothetical protein [Streptomyces drozdowiczii]|uniref:hypothetical protein n=1 Tax=Streptomyces drozdowiczii TaxID=202862 RepID=UPI00403D52B1